VKSIHLGEGVTLPLDIITMRSLVLGVSGSGKSTFGRLLAERIHEAGQRFCVIDLKNDWWGLKSSADGKHAAIPVVIVGGPRADIPLDENAGAAVADRSQLP
jgi:ABC-type glutathione transport system ATPase component